MQTSTPQPQDKKGPIHVDIGTEEERKEAGQSAEVAQAAVRAGEFLQQYR